MQQTWHTKDLDNLPVICPIWKIQIEYFTGFDLYHNQSENVTLKPHEHYIPFRDDKIQQDPNLSSEVFVTHDLS